MYVLRPLSTSITRTSTCRERADRAGRASSAAGRGEQSVGASRLTSLACGRFCSLSLLGDDKRLGCFCLTEIKSLFPHSRPFSLRHYCPRGSRTANPVPQLQQIWGIGPGDERRTPCPHPFVAERRVARLELSLRPCSPHPPHTLSDTRTTTRREPPRTPIRHSSGTLARSCFRPSPSARTPEGVFSLRMKGASPRSRQALSDVADT